MTYQVAQQVARRLGGDRSASDEAEKASGAQGRAKETVAGDNNSITRLVCGGGGCGGQCDVGRNVASWPQADAALAKAGAV